MWYFAWILGLFAAAAAGVLMALWFETRTTREHEIAHDPMGPNFD